MYTQIYTYYMEANEHLHYCTKLSIYFLCGNSNYNLTIKKKNENNILSLFTLVFLYQILNLVHHTQSYTSVYLKVTLAFTYELKEYVSVLFHSTQYLPNSSMARATATPPFQSFYPIICQQRLRL